MKTSPISIGWRTAIMVIAVVLFPLAPAQAHVQRGGATGFTTGFYHPWSGWDHILAMVAVGVWGVQLGRPAIWLLPVTFPVIMSIGGFLGLIGCPLPGTEVGIGLSALLLGLMVAAEARPPLWVAILMVGIFGLYHGHAHGTELPPNEDGLSYSIGFVMATGCLHGVGITLGLVHRWKTGTIVLRIAGMVIALGGAFFTWRAML
ncbi:MAG TPA: HupE/UreJ family protein [Verrucomicrobiae bacterium]|nr:HupE/UreJ family protein [Verrucomicrobiae bacterium]